MKANMTLGNTRFEIEQSR